jgi:Fur family ferric uptake transcriptional regulator
VTISTQIEYTSLLRSHGLKATPQRVQVLSLLATQKKPMSIAELQKKSTKNNAIDTVTLYRSLDTLIKSELVRSVDLRHGHTDYEFIGEGAHHHHLVCEKCGAIEDFDWCPEESFKQKILKNTSQFAAVTDHSLELFGICKKCVTA